MKIRVDVEISDKCAAFHGWESKEQMRGYFKRIVEAAQNDLKSEHLDHIKNERNEELGRLALERAQRFGYDSIKEAQRNGVYAAKVLVRVGASDEDIKRANLQRQVNKTYG
tara:strand:+ start:319 stop:651 length:333 start_codon:yes stop_codon:yes gene_type:complete